MKYLNNIGKAVCLHCVLSLCIAFGFSVSSASVFAAMDNATANAFLKDNDCTKCHSVKKNKKGPSYKKIAGKYKGKADAMDKLYKQVTTGPEFELKDGSKEEHKILKDDPQVIKDLLEWILAL
ncbi:MAG: c-type cytochrome [Gammaproteobacteria bacterium]|nr:c-type cytochrome [Gammaproteobacteria bacterium]